MTGNWSNYASMLVPRSQMGCLVLDDCLYVIGGTNRRNEVLQSVERYHFKEDRSELFKRGPGVIQVFYISPFYLLSYSWSVSRSVSWLLDWSLAA